jgi:hypothetical protein
MVRLVGHYAPWLLTAVLGLLIVLTVVPQVTELLQWRVMIPVFAAAVFLAVALFAHGRRLCEHCIRALPLDASTVAQRYRVRFRTAHLFERRPLAFGYLGVVLTSSLLYDHPVGRYVWAVAQATLAYLLVVYVTHQRLQPWCPQCRAGGEELTAPSAPNPVTSQV